MKILEIFPENLRDKVIEEVKEMLEQEKKDADKKEASKQATKEEIDMVVENII